MKTTARIGLLMLALLSFFSCKAYTDLSVDAFGKMLTDDTSVQLVDVRTAEEFAEGHIARAALLDWKGEGFLDKARALLDPSRPVLVYCRSGRRSAEAAKALSKASFRVFNLQGGYLAWTGAGCPVTRYEVERFLTPGGHPVDITLIKHGSLAISCMGLFIQVDPVEEFGKHTDYASEFPKADLILVTHEHPDHLEAKTIDVLSGEHTRLLLNATSAGILGRGEVLANGDSLTLSEGIALKAVPAYNTTPGRERFHPKGNGNGYVLTIDGLRIYIAGDTEDIPEMADLKAIDVAFLPVNQPFTMTVDQCVAAVGRFAPKVLIPYHFSQTDLSGLPGRLPQTDVRLRQMQ